MTEEAEEYLEQNTEYTGNEFDVFHIIDIAKFMNDFAKFKTKELEKKLQKEHIQQLSLLDQIKELKEEIKMLNRKLNGLQILLNIETGAKAALCECSPDAQIIPCPAGDNCIHEQNKP